MRPMSFALAMSADSILDAASTRMQGSVSGIPPMNVSTISPTATSLQRVWRLANSDTPPDAAIPSRLEESAAEPEAMNRIEDHVFWQMVNDQTRLSNTFTAFAEALVPCLARIAVERPSIAAQDFDLRNEGGRLRVIDTDMSTDDIAYLESRLNSHPTLCRLATEFNESVVDTYGDRKHPMYTLRAFNGTCEKGLQGLTETVDRDVKFMSLLRSVRDADCGEGLEGDYYREHRYELAATKVRDLIMSPETYRNNASTGAAAVPISKPSVRSWKA